MPFAPLVSKIRCHNPNKKGSQKANKNYLLYIATREGVDISNLNEYKNLLNVEHEDIIHKEADNELYLRYMAERPKSHGLLGNIDTSDLNKVANMIQELTKNGKNIYRGIISLSERDAEALGYTNKEKWFDYLKKVMPDIAKELKLSLNYSWVFAFHGEKTHPHIHFQLWDNSDRVKSPFIHTSVQNRIRNILSEAMFDKEYENMIKEVFKSEREELNNIRNQSRNYLTSSVKDILDNLITPGSTKEKFMNRITIEDISNLTNEFKNLISILPVKGSVDYAYLPPYVKEQVDKITDIMLEKVDMKKEFSAYIKAVEEGHKILGKTQFQINIEKEKAIKDIYKRIGNIISKKAKQCKELHINIDEEHIKNIELSIKGTEESSFLNHDFDINEDFEAENIESNNFIMEWNDNYRLALKYLYDQEHQNFDKAREILLKEILNNNVLAIYELGKIYEKGLGVESNKLIAEEYYKKALQGFLILENKNQNKYIEYRIGKIYAFGKGTDINFEKAIQWLKKSSSENYKYAQYTLAKIYLKGISDENREIKSLYSEAVSLLKKSADQNFAYAQYELGNIYENGIIAEKDKELSYKYYSLACKGFIKMLKDVEDDNLLYRVGKMYYEGKGIESDPNKAVDYLEKSAKLNNPNAQYLLAKIYLESGNQEKISEAINWLQKSSENNNEYAMYTLGIIYMDERFNNKDINKAISYFNKAAEKGNQFAQYQLGKIYYENENFRNINLAIRYFKDASEQNNEFAFYYLGKIYSDKNSEVYNIKEAIKWYTKAANLENDYAQYQLGKIFLFNREYKNEELGLYYLTRSAEKGNEYAKETLELYYNLNNNILPVISYELFKSFINLLTYNNDQAKQKINDKLYKSKSKQAKKEAMLKKRVPGNYAD